MCIRDRLTPGLLFSAIETAAGDRFKIFAISFDVIDISKFSYRCKRTCIGSNAFTFQNKTKFLSKFIMNDR